MKALLIITLLSFSVVGQTNSVEDGWKDLLPFKSTRADVERIFGRAKAIRNAKTVWQYTYENSEAWAGFQYSALPCKDRVDSLYRLDLPEGTILRYVVILKRSIPIAELSFDKKRFIRVPDDPEKPPQPWFSSYQSNQDLDDLGLSQFRNGTGIEMIVDVVNGNEFVSSFKYGTPWGELEKHPCKKQEK